MGRADVEVAILGRTRARVDGRAVDLGGPRQQVLLAILAANAGRTVANDQLVDAVWDGDPPAAASRTFRSYVARLRRAFDRAGTDGKAVVRTETNGYRLDPSVRVDTDGFEQRAEQALEHLSRGEVAEAVRLTGEALDMWEGPALGPFADRTWAVPLAARLEERRRGAAELRAGALLDADRVPQAVALLEELTAAEPYRESVTRLHALALYRSGRDADALRVARAFRSRLVQEHGLDPTDRLGELESMVLARDPRLDRSAGGRSLRGYVVHEPIATSPLGTAHRAEQPSIGREVAITVLPAPVADDPEVVRAFEARLQAVARLDHPNVVPIHDYWREPGAAFVVTRLPAGTLEQALRAGRITSQDATRVGRQVGDALAAAHARGVVHGAVGVDAVVVDARGDALLWGFSPSGQPGRPAADVAALARMVVELAGRGSPDVVDVAAQADPTTSARVREVLARATDPAGGPVVSAAGLATVLAESSGSAAEPVAALEVGPNPYRGLMPFGETDGDVFFGRSDLTDHLVARVRRHRAVAVVGPSGSGKSSIARAGVLPRLRAAGGFVTVMTPGDRPLAALEVALSRVASVELRDTVDEVVSGDGLGGVVRRVLPNPTADLVLVVDQLEELFTLSHAAERDLFLTVLARAVDDPSARVRVLLVLRADFLADVLRHPVAGPLVRDRSAMVGPLDEEELHAVVVGPAEVAGVEVEPALTTALVADAVHAPGSLPMVQFALTEVYAAADGVMTLDAYRRIGGIRGVLGQRAEEVHASLDDDGRAASRVLFQRLVQLNDGGPPTRRRARRSELERIPLAVVEAFGHARLLRFDREERSREPTVEVSHEALFGAWPRLAGWIDEGADDLRLLAHLTAAAAEWEAGGREPAELYRGGRLDAALAFAATRGDALSRVEATFLDAASSRRQRERESVQRTVRRLRGLSGALAVGLVLALLAGSLAWTARRREAQARQREQLTAMAAQVDELAFAAGAAVGEDPERASLLAAHAYALDPDVESQAALLDVLDVEPRILSLRPTDLDTCSERTGAGEEVLFATVSTQGEGLELRTLDHDVVRRFPLTSSPTFSCAGVTPVGEHVLVRHDDRYEVLDFDMQPVATRQDVLAPASQRSLDFHPTRPEVALVRDDGAVELASLPGLRTSKVLDLPLDRGATPGGGGQAVQGPAAAGTTLVRSVAYSEDATLLAVADADAVHVVDDGGDVVSRMDAAVHPSGNAFPFVSDGAGVVGHLAARSLVVASLDRPERLVEIDLRGQTTPYRRGVAVEPGGRRAAVATRRGIEVVDLVDRMLVGDPIAVDAGLVDLYWPGAGRLVALGPNGVQQFVVDRTLLLGELVAEFETGQGAATTVASDGSGVVVLGSDRAPSSYVDASSTATLDLGPGVLATPMAGGRWLALDPAAGTVTTGDAGGVRSSVEVREVAGVDARRWTMDAEGDRVVVLLRDTGAGEQRPERSVVLVLDAANGALLDRLEPPDGVTWTAARAVGDDELLLADIRYRWTIIDAQGEVVDGPRVPGVGQEVAAVDDATGRYATADWNGDVHVVDPSRDVVVDLVGPASFAVDVAFARDDRLVSRHVDGSTYVWDVAAGSLLGRMWQSAPFAFFGMAVDRSNDDLLQVTPEGVARIPLAPDDWLDAVCSRVERRLTATEIAAIAEDLVAGPGCPGGDE